MNFFLTLFTFFLHACFDVDCVIFFLIYGFYLQWLFTPVYHCHCNKTDISWMVDVSECTNLDIWQWNWIVICIVDHNSTAKRQACCLFVFVFLWTRLLMLCLESHYDHKKYNGMCWTRATELTGAYCILIPNPMHVKKRRRKKGRPRNCANNIDSSHCTCTK